MKEMIFLILGWFSFGLGVFGFFLPIVPSVPFMILAAYFFSKGSKRIHAWLLSRPYMGSAISDWENHRVLRKDVKWGLSLSLTLMVSYPLYFLTLPLIAKIAMVLLTLAAIFLVWRFPSSIKNPTSEN